MHITLKTALLFSSIVAIVAARPTQLGHRVHDAPTTKELIEFNTGIVDHIMDEMSKLDHFPTKEEMAEIVDGGDVAASEEKQVTDDELDQDIAHDVEKIGHDLLEDVPQSIDTGLKLAKTLLKDLKAGHHAHHDNKLAKRSKPTDEEIAAAVAEAALYILHNATTKMMIEDIFYNYTTPDRTAKIHELEKMADTDKVLSDLIVEVVKEHGGGVTIGKRNSSHNGATNVMDDIFALVEKHAAAEGLDLTKEEIFGLLGQKLDEGLAALDKVVHKEDISKRDSVENGKGHLYPGFSHEMKDLIEDFLYHMGEVVEKNVAAKELDLTDMETWARLKQKLNRFIAETDTYMELALEQAQKQEQEQ